MKNCIVHVRIGAVSTVSMTDEVNSSSSYSGTNSLKFNVEIDCESIKAPMGPTSFIDKGVSGVSNASVFVVKLSSVILIVSSKLLHVQQGCDTACE